MATETPARAAAVAVVLGGCIVLVFGWWLGIGYAKSLSPGVAVTVKPNTAACFVLSGVSLWLLAAPPMTSLRRYVGVACAMFVACAGALSVVEDISGLNFGIDEILFRDDPSAPVTKSPGRMSAHTGVNFILVGAALALLGKREPSALAFPRFLALAAAIFAFAVVVGIGFDAAYFGGTPLRTPMALFTALLFLALTGGMLTIGSSRGATPMVFTRGVGGTLLRRLLPGVVALPILLGSIRLVGQDAGWFNLQLGLAIMVSATIVLLAALAYYTARGADSAARSAHAQALELAERECRFQSVMEAATEAIVCADAMNRILYCNKGTESLFGYSAAEVLGQQLTLLMPERFHERHLAGLARLVATGQSRLSGKTIELVGRRKDGSEFPVDLSISTWKSQEGICCTGIMRDVSERKRLEEVRSNFVTMLSHDLRNVLQVIVGYAAIVQERLPADAEESREIIARMLAATEHTRALTTNFIDYAFIEDKGLTLHRGKANINELVRDVVQEVGAIARLAEVSVDVHLAEHLPEQLLDRPLVHRIVSNLLGNAIKFSPAGGCVQIATARSNGRVVLSVADEGPGIPPAARDGLFGRFERRDTNGRSGSGLGLFIVKTFVEAHGGRVTLTCPPEGGSVFSVSLPDTGPD